MQVAPRVIYLIELARRCKSSFPNASRDTKEANLLNRKPPVMGTVAFYLAVRHCSLAAIDNDYGLVSLYK